MSEHLWIKKRQRQRRQGAINLTTRRLLGLILLAITVYAAFRIWVGNPMESLCGDDCESMYSLAAWILGFAMMFGAIIAAGAVVGVIIALLRRRRANNESAFASRFGLDAQAPDKPENEDTQG